MRGDDLRGRDQIFNTRDWLIQPLQWGHALGGWLLAALFLHQGARLFLIC